MHSSFPLPVNLCDPTADFGERLRAIGVFFMYFKDVIAHFMRLFNENVEKYFFR
jgi:hypothetical protein